MKKIPSLLAKLGLVFCSVLLTLLVLEIGLRFLGPPPASAPLIPDAVLDHVKMRDFAFKSYSPDDQFSPFVVYWDKDGLVADPEKKTVWKPEVHKRTIALMGDSFVEASQVPYAGSFAGLLNTGAKSDVFCLNWGVSSYSPMIYVPLWRTRVAQTHPAHVFLLLYENDIGDDGVYAAKATFDADGLPTRVTAKSEPFYLEWIRRSSLFRTIRFAVIKIQASQAAKTDRNVANAGRFQEQSPEIAGISEKCLLGLKREVEASGAKFTILAVPSHRADISGVPASEPPSFASRVAAWCANNGVDYIDLEEPFLRKRQEVGKPGLFFDKDIHFTAPAHELVAKAIMAKYPEYFGGGGK